MTTADPRTDQIQAAATDARRQVLDDAAARGRLVVNRPTGLTLRILADFVASLSRGPLLGCAHAQAGPCPLVGWAVAPSAVFCRACADDLADGIPASGCDGCDRDPVATLGASAVHRTLELRFRLCRHCAGQEGHPCRS